MSRRTPNPAAERAAQNSQTIKSLLKLEGNKVCADCKRNKHPRWASWNLGIFVCIRCSGIHRGMGTHISRVKSVDLDAWTDEQLQSVLKWGNSRANKYWEAKLAPGHVPSESKIENFIRTKYESKRWVMEGPIPDPSTLDAEGDDDIPLNLVKEKHNIERTASQKASSGLSSSPGPSHVRRAPQQDLFADDMSPPPRATSSAPVPSRPQPKAEPAPPKQTKPADSLLGLDFFGDAAPPPNRPTTAAPTPGVQSRPDLKQSILSLYASAPRPQQPQQPSQSSQGSFGGMQSAPQQSPRESSFGGMNDAFSSLSFSNAGPPPAQAQPKQSAFAGLGNVSSHRSPPSVTSAPLSGGSFFDAKPVQKQAAPPAQPSRGFSSSSGFGAFDSAPGMSPAPLSNNTNSVSGMADLFEFSAPAPSVPPKPTVASPTMAASSVFNLSQPAPLPKQQNAPAMSTGWGNTDAWGSNDAWSSSQTSPPVAKPAPPQGSGDFGWGSAGLASQSIVPGGGGGFAPASHAPPKVSVDEDFGGWSSAAPVTPAAGKQAKPATGFTASEDLFSNVWE
ncbi:ADP-ribosylation factor GTPase-activating effector 2 [Hyphodiscus hymeniophilus]|uniref:ADP-ribosylation factor GTPase-activating effector 2 n=1 Tax=Hyphodiscus hymeniophilus TaxID=353542 RepID=A0A9P6VDY8_9HELO|nr:ADP-ribosylation factor GTPase-activating effector 2 [Hyphodiscus hymeniophilus]